MSSNGSIIAEAGNSGTEASSKRWSTDSAGRRVYYPYGRARSGYVVTDAARENAIRDADRRFEDISKRTAPYISLLLLPVIYVFHYFVGSHPILSYAVFPAALVLAGLMIWLVRRPTMAPLLAGLDRVPPADPTGLRYLYRAGYVLLGLGGLIALVLHLYDQRVAAVAAYSKTIDFYPDISQNLVYASFSALLLFGAVVGWNRMSTKGGPVKAMAAVALLAILALIQVVEAVAIFRNPQSKIVLSEFTLYCGWNVGWVDITSVTSRSGSRGRQYARVEFAIGRSPSGNQMQAEDCEIDGLNAEYTEVYEAIRRRWQVASQSQPAIDSMADKPTAMLREQLKQIPIGTSREKVTAILGEPLVTHPSGFGQVRLYPRNQAGETSSSMGEAWRVVAVSFDENHRVERLAVYGLSNGKVVDDISHQTLATSYDYYGPLVVLLDPRWAEVKK